MCLDIVEATRVISKTNDPELFRMAKIVIYRYDLECMKETIRNLGSDIHILTVDSVVHHALYLHDECLYFDKKRYYEDLVDFVVELRELEVD